MTDAPELVGPALVLFLSEAELIELTGYRQPAKQVAHLKVQRIPFHTNRAGHPRVARTAIDGRRTVEPAKAKTWSPSWGVNPA